MVFRVLINRVWHKGTEAVDAFIVFALKNARFSTA